MSTHKPSCPVAPLAELHALISDAYNRLDEARSKAEQHSPEKMMGADRAMAEVCDRQQAIMDQASFMLAKSMTGALFQVYIASLDFDHLDLSNDHDRGHIRRRINRCLVSVARFLKAGGGDIGASVWDGSFRPDLDPHKQLAEALK